MLLCFFQKNNSLFSWTSVRGAGTAWWRSHISSLAFSDRSWWQNWEDWPFQCSSCTDPSDRFSTRRSLEMFFFSELPEPLRCANLPCCSELGFYGWNSDKRSWEQKEHRQSSSLWSIKSHEEPLSTADLFYSQCHPGMCFKWNGSERVYLLWRSPREWIFHSGSFILIFPLYFYSHLF